MPLYRKTTGGSLAIKEDGTSVLTTATTLNFVDLNAEDGGSNQANIYHNIPAIADGRLTLGAGTPVTADNVSSATSIYYTPFKGNKISLYDGTRWKMYSFTEGTLTVPSTVYRNADVFIYDNSGTLTLESVNWDQTSGTFSGATNATPIVGTSTSHGLAIGDMVGVNGLVGNTALNGYVWCVSGTTTNTITFDSSTGNGVYSSGGTWYKINNTRTTALVAQDGVYVKTGETNKKYLGTFCTTKTSGQTEDSKTARLLWNYYNKVLRSGHILDGTSHTYTSTTTDRYFNNDPNNKFEFVAGVTEDALYQTISISISVAINGTQVAGLYIGFDSISQASSAVFSNAAYANTGGTDYITIPAAGRHLTPILEFMFQAGTGTFNAFHSRVLWRA